VAIATRDVEEAATAVARVSKTPTPIGLEGVSREGRLTRQ